MIAILKLFSLLLLLSPIQATAQPVAKSIHQNTGSDSIHFIALPYLCAFQHDQHNHASMLRDDKNQQALADHLWMISLTNIPEFTTHHGQLNIIDHDLHSSYKLSADLHNIIIPIQISVTRLPLQSDYSDRSPLWLRYVKKDHTIWHAPSLTPAVKAQLIAEQKRNAQQAEKLAERMADRAFYFGYDTNDDALK